MKLNFDIESVSLHPGTILTNLGREMPVMMKLANIFSVCLKYFCLKTISQGASTTVRCVVMNSKILQNGEYYDSCNVAMIRYGITTKDYSNAIILWQWSLKLIQQKGFNVPVFE